MLFDVEEELAFARKDGDGGGLIVSFEYAGSFASAGFDGRVIKRWQALDVLPLADAKDFFAGGDSFEDGKSTFAEEGAHILFGKGVFFD